MFSWTVLLPLWTPYIIFFLFHYLYCIHISIKNYHIFEIISVIGTDLSSSFSFSEKEREREGGGDCQVFGWTVVDPVFFLFHYSYFIYISIKNHHICKIISIIEIELFSYIILVTYIFLSRSFSFSEREREGGRETAKCLVKPCGSRIFSISLFILHINIH